eukprot:RCo000436
MGGYISSSGPPAPLWGAPFLRYTPDEVAAAGYSPTQMLQGGFTPRELALAGYLPPPAVNPFYLRPQGYAGNPYFGTPGYGGDVAYPGGGGDSRFGLGVFRPPLHPTQTGPTTHGWVCEMGY